MSSCHSEFFGSHHNSVVSTSALLLDFFSLFYLFSHFPWFLTLVGFAEYIGSNFLRDHNIARYHHCFSPSTMKSFHHQRCWLLFFEVFLWLFPTDKWDHSLGLLLTLEVLFWAIIISLYIFIVFSQHNGVVSLSPFLIVIYWSFYLIPYHILVQPLIWITAYIGSTFLRNHNIAIYHLFFPLQWRWFIVTIFIVLYLFLIPPHGWLQPLIGIDNYIGSIFLRDHIISRLILLSMISFEVLCWVI